MEAKRCKLDSDIIEQLNNCPICTGIPEKEIFQCSAGHVICHSCISKVTGGLCPQCRVPFGVTKIRNRILEQLLDAQVFPCKFSGKGCIQICKREEITTHSRFCCYNPDLVPYCEQMRHRSCKFKLGTCSRAEVISHFSNAHGKTLSCLPTMCVITPWQHLLDGKMLDKIDSGGMGNFLSPADNETSPLFLHYVHFNKPVGYLSFFCVKVWESESNPMKNYKVEYSFNKGPSKTTEGGSSNLSLSTLGVGSSPILTWAMKVYDIKEATQILKENPIKASIPYLKENLKGGNSGDCFIVTISRVG